MSQQETDDKLHAGLGTDQGNLSRRSGSEAFCTLLCTADCTAETKHLRSGTWHQSPTLLLEQLLFLVEGSPPAGRHDYREFSQHYPGFATLADRLFSRVPALVVWKLLHRVMLVLMPPASHVAFRLNLTGWRVNALLLLWAVSTSSKDKMQ